MIQANTEFTCQQGCLGIFLITALLYGYGAYLGGQFRS